MQNYSLFLKISAHEYTKYWYFATLEVQHFLDSKKFFYHLSFCFPFLLFLSSVAVHILQMPN